MKRDLVKPPKIPVLIVGDLDRLFEWWEATTADVRDVVAALLDSVPLTEERPGELYADQDRRHRQRAEAVVDVVADAIVEMLWTAGAYKGDDG